MDMGSLEWGLRPYLWRGDNWRECGLTEWVIGGGKFQLKALTGSHRMSFPAFGFWIMFEVLGSRRREVI